MKQIVLAAALVLAALAPTSVDAMPANTELSPASSPSDLDQRNMRLLAAARGFLDMASGLTRDSPGHEAANGLFSAASEGAHYAQAVSAMVYIWETGCKAPAGRSFLRFTTDGYVKQFDFLIKQVNLSIARAPAGVAAAGLELRKLLEETADVLRHLPL